MQLEAENIADMLQRALEACAARRFDHALGLLYDLVRRAPDAFDAWLLLSQLELRQQAPEAAARSAARALSLRPASADALYALGRAFKSSGDASAAVGLYQRALAVRPQDPDILTSCGVALRALGRLDEAIAAYRRALVSRPDHAEAHHNLANAIAARDGEEEARRHREQGRGALNASLQAILEGIARERRAGRLDDAFESYRDALRLAPGSADLWLQSAALAQEMGFEYLGLQHYERALGLNPESLPAVDAARRISATKGLHERAERYSRRTWELARSDSVLVSWKLLLPAIQESCAAIAASRARYALGLEEILSAGAHLERPDGVIGSSAFYLAYHGCDDKALQVRAAQVYLEAMPALRMTAEHCLRAQRRPGRLRIGFISRFLHAHSIGKTTRGLIEQLSREIFEVTAIRITPTRSDDITALITAAAEHTLTLDTEFFRAREQIAALELDVIFYQDIGMDSTTYFLAFARLAPVQCVSFGHPNTTGIPTMDYFVSNDLYEIAGAQENYSERLFLLEGLPTLAYYHRPRRGEPLGREVFGLPAEAHVYLCPQTLFKLHPDFDALLRGILTRDRAGILVLVEALFEEYTERLRHRFAATLDGLADRILFVSPQSQERFLELLAVADVSLDTLHFNGMNSSLESFAVGTPVVTLPTQLQRGRHTQAMYRKMGILDCIARDPQDYVDIAVRIGTDQAYAAALRTRILQENHVLFESREVVREFERFFLAACSPGSAAPPAARIDPEQ